MELPKRQQKIFDFFLYWNEIDILLLRLHELDSYVTNFVIIEFDLNFKLNQYKKFLDLGSSVFDRFREKIIHLNIEFKNYDEYYDAQIKKLKVDSLLLHEKFFVKSFDEIKNFLEIQNADFEDVVMFSHVDEIPDLSLRNKIINSLVYGPVLFKNHNFVFTTEYYQENSHIGTQIYNYSMIVRNNNILFEIHKKKFDNEKTLPVTILKGGWHLSHMNRIENVVENLNHCSLIYNKKFEVDDVVKSLKNLSPITDRCPKAKFKKRDINLPENIHLVNQNLEFETSKFIHLIAIETEQIEGEYTSVRKVNYTENPTDPFETYVGKNIYEYNLLVPEDQFYESDNFSSEYKFNDIKLVIQWIEPLENDTIIIKTNTSTKKFEWYEIKDKELYYVI